MPHIIAACNSASFPADEDRVIFDFDVSEAATHVPEDSFHTALKILFMNEGCLTILQLNVGFWVKQCDPPFPDDHSTWPTRQIAP
jgi:hypothetical protein